MITNYDYPIMKNIIGRRVCITEALYPLTFYLLISSKQQIEDTIFILDRHISSDIIKKLKHVIIDDIDSVYSKNKYLKALTMLFKRRLMYSFIYNADIYGLDFKWYWLRGLKMTYIEDGPDVQNIWETGPMYQFYLERENESFFKKKIKDIIFSNYYGRPVGSSKDVTDIITTGFYNKTYHKGKKVHIQNWQNLWENSSIDKKTFLLSIFDITKQDIFEMTSKKVILLTQAFY